MKKNLILASSSPRRKEILELLNIPFEVITSNSDEVMDPSLPLAMRIEEVAYQKAKAVYRQHPNSVVIGADTIVEIDGEVLGKPHSRQDAIDMMHKLSGKTHRVITAYAILCAEGPFIGHDITEVTFNEMSEAAINAYVQCDEAYDKAGGYAVQGWAGRYISRINGSYYTVMGLPLHLISEVLDKLNMLVL